jgi:hypothetical protein
MSDTGFAYRFLVALFAARYYALLLFVVGLLFDRFLVYRRLRHFPGPFLGSFSMIWFTKAAASRRLYAELDAACKEYGTFLAREQGRVL